MKRAGWKVSILLVLMTVLLLSLTACQSMKTSEKERTATKKVIAVLGWDEYLEGSESFLHGMEMALEEHSETLPVKWEYYNDEGDYELGLLMAQQLAQDENVVAVMSFQDFEVIDAEAHYFEETKKPLLIVQGCYEKTLERGLDYVFSTYVSSKDMGAAMATYSARKGYRRVACSHTNTIFETDEMIGFCQQAEKEGVSVVDMQQGPDSYNDLKVAYKRWEALGVDALYVCRYTETEEQKEWIFKMIEYIKKKNPDFLIMGDYSLDGAKYLEKYGSRMENVAYPNPYSIHDTPKGKEFEAAYCQKYPEEESAEDGAYQGYDMTKMICLALEQQGDKKQGDGTRIKDYFKRKDGYEGIGGTLNYSEEGKLCSAIEYYCVKNSVFVTEESYE